ncbi:MAG TPA: DUF6484 domain-containing protein [Pseudoduganella sp.]
MSGRDPIVEEAAAAADLMRSLSVGGPGIVVGEMIGLMNEGRTALVLFSGQEGTAGVPARSVVDLHASHIGSQVVLVFEGGAVGKPIIMGLLRTGDSWPLGGRPGQVEADVDGERLIVSAREQLVLRCGKASITLTKAGKVVIQGTYMLSRSTGVNLIKGGAVQIN